MTPAEYESALKELGWKQADLGKRLGVSKNMPSVWGKKGPPKYVVAYLKTHLAVDRARRAG